MKTTPNETISPDLICELLSDALIGNRAHVSPERAFEGLTWRQSGQLVSESPHTIWQLLKHLNYWQDRLISRIEGMKVLPAKTSDDGWKFDSAPEDEEMYKRELGKLLTGINYMTQTKLPQPDKLCGVKGDYPHGFGVIQAMASHISYHLGEVVLLRRMLGLWPPPSGGYTW
ncbi:MAG: hypothetical protein DHS20C17_28590 [Cyclobacteriaceae bacterium]|nr:MAG: hypothetical protein DHS20C17_28590 [Cyclobacteriaceae bacterium]